MSRQRIPNPFVPQRIVEAHWPIPRRHLAGRRRLRDSSNETTLHLHNIRALLEQFGAVDPDRVRAHFNFYQRGLTGAEVLGAVTPLGNTR
jgi:hypothetical protein